ncbi:caspase, EACC1-associated type [Sphaerisporangium perillae]|uniref:caspase, EACC1-associated type n=1 Tax=Sphaerisporangium perillae TaxID=2935860 RepID=UPI00200F5A5C|nr:caspase family protein [Sphaerisporangium perillae]
MLIGTSTYQSAGLADLPAVRNNLEGLAQVLTDSSLGGLLPEQCIVLSDPDVRTVYRALRHHAATAEDTLLVYFAGHGRTGLRYSELYLTMSDTDLDDLPVSSLRFDDVRDIFINSPAANRVLILDCCFSGRAIPDMSGAGEAILGQTEIEGTYTLTATSANEVALALPGAFYTVFTGELLTLLRTGVDDGPEILTFATLYPRLLHRLSAQGHPRPRQRGIGSVDHLALTRNPAHPTSTYKTGTPAPRPGSAISIDREVGFEEAVLLSSSPHPVPRLQEASGVSPSTIGVDDSHSRSPRTALRAARHMRGARHVASPKTTAVESRHSPRRVAVVIGLTVAVVGVALSGLKFFRGEFDRGDIHLGVGTVISADQVFASVPGAIGNGSSQVLNAVTSVGSTVVAVGTDATSPASRPLFLVSSNGGKSWELGRVTTVGAYPSERSVGRVVGGAGRWLAAGTEAPGTAGASARGMWTSTDGRTWTAVDPSRLSVFMSGDRIIDLARTASGFVAVGSTTLKDGRYGPVAWVSPDGLSWTRVDTSHIGATNKVRAIRAVVAKGDAVVALADPGKGNTTSIILRSTDGGRTWLRTAAALPGVRPKQGALVVASKGFVLVPILQKSSAGEVRVYCSDLGDEWRLCGVIGGLGPEATGVRGLVSFKEGISAVVESGWERYGVLTSSDGQDWTKSTDLGQISGTLRGFTLTDAGTLVTAGERRADGLDNLPVLMTAAKDKPARPVQMGKISGLTRSARETNALAAAENSFVAVGSVKGDAGIWTSSTGQNWKIVDSPALALGGSVRQSLNDVTHGAQGWLTVGSTTVDSAFVKPLLATSTDGRSWQTVDSPALNASGRYAVTPRVVTAGPKGYVFAGDDSGPGGVVAALWFTADLHRYERVGGLPANGAGVRLEDVVATSDGYLAVGSSGTANHEKGVVWVSPDGLHWTAGKRVIPKGAHSASLRRVLVKDGQIITVGGATNEKGVVHPFAAVSGDDGDTWEYSWLPADAEAAVLDMTSSRSGLVAIGSYGPPTTGDSTVWTSVDGRDWQRHTLTGDGMTGEGAQWLGAIAVINDKVVAVGRSTTYTADHLTLWRTQVT